MQEVAVSLVIPAHNEEAYLPRLLDTIDEARRRFRGGADAVEVVVADNASEDGTAAIAETWGARVAPVAKRCIAAARNGGAAVSHGTDLAFVDADARIHPETFNVVTDALADDRCAGGATGVTLERWSIGIAVTYALLMPWVVALRMDTGVTFCRRRDFDAIGGYNEGRLFAEDVELLWSLRRLGKPDGRRLVRATSAKAVASTRKFDRHGEWHYFGLVFRLLPKMLFKPAAVDGFAQRYWYDELDR